METASAVLAQIKAIGATKKKAEKETLLQELAQSELGKFVLKWTYDPFVTYGLIPDQPSSDPEGPKVEFDPVLIEPLLRELSSRSLTGGKASADVKLVLSSLDQEGAELLWLILMRDLKCGVGLSTIASVVPGLIQVFSVMRAHKFAEKRMKKWPMIVEPKLDGYRYTFLCRNGQGAFFSRSGIRQEAADHLIEPMIETALRAVLESNEMGLLTTLSTKPGHLGSYARSSLNFMADGEMVVDGNFNDNGALRRKGEQATNATFNIFDMMSLKDFEAIGSVGDPYSVRRKNVEGFVKHKTVERIICTPRYYVHSLDEIYSFYEAFLNRGLEGAMVKDPDGLYDKTKSYNWLKIKPEDTEDLYIQGVFSGAPHSKYENMLGGAIVGRIHKGKTVYVRVGGGWSDEEREALWRDWEEDAKTLGIDPQVGFKPGYVIDPALSLHGFKLLGRMIEVKFLEVTPDGSLRHPNHVRFRDDKAGELSSAEAA